MSNYHEWRKSELCCDFYFNGANIGPHMSLDETCPSNGEVWTFLTDKDGHGGKGTLAAAIPGTKSDEIVSIPVNAMGKTLRRKVKEVVYFADSYCPRQKVLVEYTNELTRQYIPKGTDFATVSPQFIKKVQTKLNRRPREKLNFSIPTNRGFQTFSLILHLPLDSARPAKN